MNGLVTLRQGLNRASGRLIWGQAPNELFRPFATIVGYAVAASTVTSNISGAFATLLASALTLGLIIFSPTSIPTSRDEPRTPSPDSRMFSRSANSLLVIAGVASAVERVYPMILATVGNSSDVAIFAVAMRVIQLGMFGQVLGIFIYSTPLDAALLEIGRP